MDFFNKMNPNSKKEPTEMDHIMASIAQVESEMQQRFFQLGQMYYEEHKNSNSPEEKYHDLVELINKLDQNRQGFYKYKLRLQGQMLCESCGAVIPYGSLFCNFCGTKTDEGQPDTGMGAANAQPIAAEPARCPQCGEALEPDSVFCASCGTRVG